MGDATFHEGELALQRRAGSLALLAQAGPRVIRDAMPQQHRDFFAQLVFLLAGALDAQGQPWASVLTGPAGFAFSPDPRELRVQARFAPHDPLAASIVAGAPIALLGIEPHTRRRNRLNGRVVRSNDEGFVVEVVQSFGNCPKYIQARRPELREIVAGPAAVQHLAALDERAAAMIERADTFFIATAHPQAAQHEARAFGVDVSHRGGKPGFVRVDGDAQLTVPDFAGNSYFNTLGNLVLDPRCGLLFIDFESGDLLHVAARGEIVLEGPELAAFTGAQRLMRLRVTSAVRAPAALPLRWSEAQLSPVLAATGSWR